MRYKFHLFMRGAKHFNPYEKGLHHHSSHHGGALVSDHELLSMLSLHHNKKPYQRRKTGGTVRTRPYKPLVFTR